MPAIPPPAHAVTAWTANGELFLQLTGPNGHTHTVHMPLHHPKAFECFARLLTARHRSYANGAPLTLGTAGAPSQATLLAELMGRPEATAAAARAHHNAELQRALTGRGQLTLDDIATELGI